MIRLRLAKILRTYSEHTQADNQRKMYFIDSFFFFEFSRVYKACLAPLSLLRSNFRIIKIHN